MVIGINFGPRMEAFLRLHREMLWIWVAVVVVMEGLHADPPDAKPAGELKPAQK